MSTPYSTIYTKLIAANIPQVTAEFAADAIETLGESPAYDALQLTNAFITTHKANAETAVKALTETINEERVMR
jgi:hypothetical protein